MWTAFESGDGLSGFVRQKFDLLDSEITRLEAEVAELTDLFAGESAANNAQRNSLAELPAWVVALQSAKSEDTYRIRSALQELFRATISLLSICVEGGAVTARPKSTLTEGERESMDEESRWDQKERINELVAFGHTEDEAHAYMELTKISDPERYRYFNVRFNNGSGMRVTPHPTTANEFLRIYDSKKAYDVISFIDAAEAARYARANRTLSESSLWSGDNTGNASGTP